jgi:hypothetical protein
MPFFPKGFRPTVQLPSALPVLIRGAVVSFLLAILCIPLPAKAVLTWFEGAVQYSVQDASVVLIQQNLYERQEYEAVGAYIGLDPWVWDPVAKDWVYGVMPGETWTWNWLDVKTGEIIASYSTSFVGGDDLCWSHGECGAIAWLWRALGFRCMPEEDHYQVEVLHDNVMIGADTFRPTRFVPRIDRSIFPDSIAPKRTISAEGESAEFNVLVKDDLGCDETLEGVRVKYTATVVGGSNGQTYFQHGAIGTGKFSSMGYNSTLNPGGAGEKDTVIEGDSDSDGIFKARYQAYDHGADENIRIEVKRPATDSDPEVVGEPAEKELRIAIPGLIQITQDHAPLAFADGGTCPHDPSPRWLTPNTRSRVMTLASIYHLTTGRLLSLNDGSLPYGGVLAKRRVAVETDLCHGSHRQGVDIDLNSIDRLVGTPGQESPGENMRTTNIDFRGEQWTLLDYVDFWAEELDGTDYHGTSSIHYRFPN